MADKAGEGPAGEVAAWLRALEQRQELEAELAGARRRLAEAQETREGSTAQEGWFKRRLEGRRQEKQARRHLEDTREKLKDFPSGHALKKQIGKDIQALGKEERQKLAKALPEAQAKLANRAVGVARKAAERSMGRERGRDRGMGM